MKFVKIFNKTWICARVVGVLVFSVCHNDETEMVRRRREGRKQEGKGEMEGC